jgi:methionyl aminopeptidase
MFGVNEWTTERTIKSYNNYKDINGFLSDKPFDERIGGTYNNLTTWKNYSNEPVNLYDKFNKNSHIQNLRKAAEVHKIARKYLQEQLKPGMKYTQICEIVENKVKELLGNKFEEGMGFPVGISVNNICAHDSANPNDSRIITENDIIKIDFGTHVNGRIVDSAFTVAFKEYFNPLIDSVKDATMEAIKLSGPDALMNDVSARIKEVIESYEMTDLNGKVHPIKAVSTLGGHTIGQHIIHAGKIVLCAPNDHPNYIHLRMKENEQWAIETYGSANGLGKTIEHPLMECNHYMLNPRSHNKNNLTSDSSKKCLEYIRYERYTLPWAHRWLATSAYNKSDKQNQLNEQNEWWKDGLKELVDKNVVTKYPPLCDKTGSWTAQLEHTMYVSEWGKEIVSLGDDY